MTDLNNAIGETAGKIYKALEAHRELTFTGLKEKTDTNDTALLHQGIGWLARENHIVFEKKGKKSGFSLRNPS